MNQYSLTKTWAFQWILIILVLCAVVGCYFYFQSLAAVTDRFPTNTGLVGYWKLDEGTGTAAASETGANNGTLTNGPTWSQGYNGSGYSVNFEGTDDHITIPDA